MTDSASSLLAILFGLGVFAVIVAIGWRSVQNRRILRLQGANGQETIIVAGEDDDITSVATTIQTSTADIETAQPAPAPEAGRSGTARDADAAARDRLDRVVSSTK